MISYSLELFLCVRLDIVHIHKTNRRGPRRPFLDISLRICPSFDPSFACCEGTLRNPALVFKSCFPPWHKQFFLPESVQFSARKLSSAFTNHYKSCKMATSYNFIHHQNGWSVKLRSGKMTNQSSRTMSAI